MLLGKHKIILGVKNEKFIQAYSSWWNILGGILFVSEAVQIGTLQALALATLLFLIINAIVMFVFSLIVALFYVMPIKRLIQ